MPDTELEPMPDDWRRALAIVAHPDDMEYGAAAAVAAWTASGKHVVYVMATRGEAGIDSMAPADAARVRAEEQRAACDAVGVETLEFLDHRDGILDDALALRRDFAAAIRRHRPELVITLNHHDTWTDRPGAGWNSADHRAVGRAVLDAVGDAGNRWIFADLGLEPWAGVRWVAVAASPRATHAVAVADHLDAAVASLTAHQAYLDGLSGSVTDARAVLVEAAGATGRRFGGQPAVAFELFGM